MDKKELEARIELHEGCIKSLRADLAEAEQPELEHLDFGDNGDDKWIKIFGDIHWIGRYEQEHSGRPDETFVESRQGNLGNIFDELKARAEPLTEFEFKNGVYMAITGVWGNGSLQISDKDGYVVIQKENLPAFILNLQRLYYTAMRNK